MPEQDPSSTSGKKGGTLWGGHLQSPPSSDNVAFCAGRDVTPIHEADRELLPYDVWGSVAHTLMLQRAEILSRNEARRLLRGLDGIAQDYRNGRIVFDPAKEDVHTHIEHFLRESCGEEVAGKIHTGRSRNDQAATAMRLYVRDALLHFHGSLLQFISILLQMARRHAKAVMPGLTHRQYGTVSSLGHLWTAHAQALARDLDRLQGAFERLNVCPLGAAAGYGTSWPIDRRFTASYLGFYRPQRSALDAAGNRWEMEADLVSCFAFFCNHVSQVAADLIFLSSPAVQAIVLPDAFVTGSSIMPQKRNPDFAEVILAKAAMVRGHLASLLQMPHGQITGYNREYQWTKYLVQDAVRETKDIPEILAAVIEQIEVRTDRLKEMACEGFLNAVDVADFLSRERTLTFRQAHGVVARAVGKSRDAGAIQLAALNQELRGEKVRKTITEQEFQELSDPSHNLLWRKSIGSPSPSEVLATASHIYSELRKRSLWLKEKRNMLADARRKTQQARKRLTR